MDALHRLSDLLLLLDATLYMRQKLETPQLKRLSPLIFAGAQAGTMSGGPYLALTAKAVGSPRRTRTSWIVGGSVMKAMKRISAPQRGHASGKAASMRASSSAQA